MNDTMKNATIEADPTVPIIRVTRDAWLLAAGEIAATAEGAQA